MESIIRDIHLAESGQAKINWVKGHMPLLHYFNEKYAPLQLFKGINMIVTIHLEAKTAYLALTLKNCGANVVVTGGSEETTTGVIRLRALAESGKLAFPMVAVNDSNCKYLFDNRYGTGQSSWDGIMRTSNLSVAGKTVVVAGYGWCGKGVAMRAKGLGARVIVTEIDPIKGIEAVFDGFETLPMAEAAAKGDIFITVTGCKDVIRKEHMEVMKDGVLLANAGHFDVEINKPDLAALSVKPPFEARKNITAYTLANGHQLNLLGEGRLVNLACGDGHPTEVMDLSFAMQFLAMRHLLENKGRLENKLYVLPAELDQEVAGIKLKAMGFDVDTLTPEQDAYLHQA